MSSLPDDPQLRSAAGLQRAARRHMRAQAGVTPWLLPLLLVPGTGASRLRLLQEQSWSPAGRFDTGLWDPDDTTLHADLYSHGPAAAEELAQRWQAPREILRTQDAAAHAALQAKRWCLPPGQALLPALQAQWEQDIQLLHTRGWTSLLQAYWPLAAHSAQGPGLLGDPQFLPLAHAFAWDWSLAPEQSAPHLARHIGGLLSQDHLHHCPRRWQWPGQPGLVIVAENAGLDLVQAALPLCAAGQVLAVYAVDEMDAAVQGRHRLLSHGWHAWRQAFQDSRSPEASSPSHASATPPWISCGHRLAQTSAAIQCSSGAELCTAVLRDLTQRLLREPATPLGQALSPAFAARMRRAKLQDLKP